MRVVGGTCSCFCFVVVSEVRVTRARACAIAKSIGNSSARIRCNSLLDAVAVHEKTRGPNSKAARNNVAVVEVEINGLAASR